MSELSMLIGRLKNVVVRYANAGEGGLENVRNLCEARARYHTLDRSGESRV